MRTLISLPLLVFTTAALIAGAHTTSALAQERTGSLVITAPRYNAVPAGPPDFAPGTRVATRQRSNFGGGLFEFLATGGRDTTLTRQPSDRPWQDAAPEYDRAQDRYYGPQPYLFGRRDAPDVRETPARPAFDPRFAKQTVSYITDEKPGTVVVDTRSRFLYLVQEDGKATRYGIGVGRVGFTWSGIKTVSQMREWPDWRPPDEMRKRRPDLPVWMAGGVDNPLGARAIYLGSTLYRIHGSNEPWTIGRAVSSGCFRMRNDDVMELYDKVKIGTKVVVI